MMKAFASIQLSHGRFSALDIIPLPSSVVYLIRLPEDARLTARRYEGAATIHLHPVDKESSE